MNASESGRMNQNLEPLLLEHDLGQRDVAREHQHHTIRESPSATS